LLLPLEKVDPEPFAGEDVPLLLPDKLPLLEELVLFELCRLAAIAASPDGFEAEEEPLVLFPDES